MVKIVAFKPTFMCFAEHTFGKFMSDIEAFKSLTSMNVPLLLATVRGIFDSKYNEFMMNNDYRTFTKFPDFVYSWTNKFYICPINRCIKAYEMGSSINLD